MVTKLVVLFVLVKESLKGGIFFTFVSSFPTCNVSQGFLYQKKCTSYMIISTFSWPLSIKLAFCYY